MDLVNAYNGFEPVVIIGRGTLTADTLEEMIMGMDTSGKVMPANDFSVQEWSFPYNPYSQEFISQYHQAVVRPKKRKKIKKRRKVELVSAYLEQLAKGYEKEQKQLQKKIDDHNMRHYREIGYYITFCNYNFAPEELTQRLEQVVCYMACLDTYRDPRSRSERRKDEEDPKPPRMRDFFENQRGKRKWSS
ncbi:hypothetical protein GZH47_33680 (plasmid) [Paenibacillus rhizovicinus]|uniref:Uncharacterized protein n=1 Tax=Paenibacillus rhizovicinus TaxID=2704463 RepID=A0A6C0PBT8_9BACL|nr:hypothetical protein [Paenibacillus rhizovicinus]QHW35845.1 hypothetical protein GZH47_33680 [Paenibacillus rhizovicinus]